MRNRSSPEDEAGGGRLSLVLGLASSLSVGFFEMILVTLLFAPPKFPPLPAVLAALVGTILLFAFAYFALWFLIVSRLGHRLRLHEAALGVSLATFLGTTLTLLSVRWVSDSLGAQDVLKSSLLLVLCLLAAVGSYHLAKSAIGVLERSGVAAFLGIATPVFLAEAMVLAWLCRHRFESFFAAPSLAAAAVYVVVAVLTAGLLFRIRERLPLLKCLAISAMLVLGSPVVALVVTAAAATLPPESAPGSWREEGRSVKSVILITDDTLRPDFLSCYGAQGNPTPHIDRLAEDGVLFARAYSAAPWTVPSLASILTGLSPPVHQATKRNPRLADGARTLAEYMRDAGFYTTAFAQFWHLGDQLNLSQGFLEFNPQDPRLYPTLGGALYPTLGGRLVDVLFPGRLEEASSARALTRSAADWLVANQGKDFFLWIHYLDPHMPYTPPPDLLDEAGSPNVDGLLATGVIRSGFAVPTRLERERLKSLYSAEVRLVDEGLGRLLAVLDQLGLYDQTLIVFASDHGEEFWEHGGFEHGHSLYDEVIRVPLIVKPPHSTAHRRIETPMSTTSVLPTILDLSGIEYVDDTLSEPSLRALWEGDAGAALERPIVSTSLVFYEDRESVVLDQFKYIRSLVGDREELYDLVNDPQEQVSVVSQHPERARRARAVLEATGERNRVLARYHRFALEEESEMDEETRRQLEALGYLARTEAPLP